MLGLTSEVMLYLLSAEDYRLRSSSIFRGCYPLVGPNPKSNLFFNEWLEVDFCLFSTPKSLVKFILSSFSRVAVGVLVSSFTKFSVNLFPGIGFLPFCVISDLF